MIFKNSNNILFIINSFGVFGSLFSIFLLFFSWFYYVVDLDFSIQIFLLFGVVSFYFILFLSLIYLRWFIFFFPNLSADFIRKFVFFLCFLYYLFVFVRFFCFDVYGVRGWLGFVTPLWVVSLLIVFNNLNRKILISSYFFIFIEMIAFYFIFLSNDAMDLKQFSFSLSFSVLLTFPFFLNFFNRYGGDLRINKSIFKPLLILNSILGVFFIFYYYLLF